MISELAQAGCMPSILALESVMRGMQQVEMPVEHYFIDGVYLRSLKIPAGTLLTGKIHNKENFSILASGTIRITNGTDSKVISAPYVMTDKPGIKRMGYAETDVTFINVIKTDLTDIDEIERELVSETFEDYEMKRLGRN
jgi:hypothetical protein